MVSDHIFGRTASGKLLVRDFRSYDLTPEFDIDGVLFRRSSIMLSKECVRELRSSWLPNMTDEALNHLIDLLEKGSPLLIHGSFTRAVPMGCLATHIAWNHPRTSHCTLDAGINWLHGVAGLNPATSHVIREWDRCGAADWEMRADLLAVFKEHRRERAPRAPRPERQPCQASV
jgi:hypothetical protein